MDRIVLAYSGGLDTSVAIPWLADQHDAQIVTVTMDLGQGKELEDARERALALGAARAHVLDLRTEFARDFILPALQAGAVYEDRYPVATGCGAEKGNDAVRIDLAVRALDADLTVLAPLGQWDVPRADKVAYAKA